MRPSARRAATAGTALVVLFASCAIDRKQSVLGPSLPADPPASQLAGSVWGYVVDRSGVCLNNVTVQIVSGPGAGRHMTQAVPCDAWSYGNGFWFSSLPPGDAVTIRASRAGYGTQEVRAVIRTSGYADLIVLLPE